MTARSGAARAARQRSTSITLAAALMTLGPGSASASRSCAASSSCMASTPSRSRSSRTVRPVARSMSASESRQVQPSRAARRCPTVVLPAPMSPTSTTWRTGRARRRMTESVAGCRSAYTRSDGLAIADPAARRDRDPGRRSARPDARARGASDGLPGRRPRPGSGLPGGVGRRRRRGRARTTTWAPRSGWPIDATIVTYELEHVAADVVAALEARLPVRPGHRPLTVTQDRLAERRFVEAAGVAVAPWREVRSPEEASGGGGRAGPAAPAQAADRRVRRSRPAADPATPDELDDAWARLGRPSGSALLAERELAFECELSIVLARDVHGIDGGVPGRPKPARRWGSWSSRWRRRP